jgi:nucleolar protein 58
MLILLETPAGFALFSISNENKLKKIDDIFEYMQDTSKAGKL